MARRQETTGQPDTVGQRIRRARHDRGLTQEALAERIGVTTDTVGRFEEGEGDASRYLRRIAVATGKTVSYFVDDVEVRRRGGITRRVRAAAGWLEEGTEPAGGDAEAALARRSAALSRREQAVAELEIQLEARLHALETEVPRPSEIEERVVLLKAQNDEAARRLAEAEREREQRARELQRREQELAGREGELARRQQELAERAVALGRRTEDASEQVAVLHAAN
jgi:transcriptional regulator with XRE-family HTH domain